MRKLWVVAIIGLIAINFSSAAFGGNFSLGNFLDVIDSSTMILGTLFVIFLAMFQFALSKWFKNKSGEVNKPVVTVMSLALSLLMVYGINKMGWDIENFFYSIGLSSDLLGTIIPIVIVIALLLLFWKLKSTTILLLGLLFIFLGIFDIAEKDPAFMVGGLLIVIWLLWKLISWIAKKKGSGYSPTKPSSYNDPNSKSLREYEERAKEAERQRKEADKKREEFENESERQRKKADEEARRRAEEEKRRIDEGRRRAEAEKKQQEAEEGKQREYQKRWEELNRYRKESLRKLDEERQRLQSELDKTNDYLKNIGSLRAFPERRKDESDFDYEQRYKRHRENHKLLSQAHERRSIITDNLQKVSSQMDELNKAIAFREKKLAEMFKR